MTGGVAFASRRETADSVASPLHHLSGRVLVCAEPGHLPPFHGGGAQILGRMLAPVDPADYVLVTFGTPELRMGGPPRLRAKRYHLPSASWPPGHDPSYPLGWVRARRKFVAEMLYRARLLARIVRRERCAAVLVSSTPAPDLPAAWLASIALGIPLIPYLLDDWRHLVAAGHPAVAGLAAMIEPLVLARSAAVMAISPLLAAELERDWGIATDVVSHPLPIGTSLEQRPTMRPWPARSGEIRLVFTGQVYDAHFDALATILRALEQPGLEQVTLHLYSSGAERLEGRGIEGRFVVHQPVPPDELAEVQRNADILLLPLGFDTPYPEIVRTALPTKTVDYVVSGRPILIYGPPNSYVAMLARNEGAGGLVAEPDSRAVAREIRRVIEDASYRQELVDGAWATAQRYHSPKVTTARFREVIDRVIDARRGKSDGR